LCAIHIELVPKRHHDRNSQAAIGLGRCNICQLDSRDEVVRIRVMVKT
jgi:hypothetical protein